MSQLAAEDGWDSTADPTQQALGREITHHDTVAGQAHPLLESSGSATLPAAGGALMQTPLYALPAFLATLPVDAPAPLSFAQEHMWLLHHLQAENITCHVELTVRLVGELSLPALERSLQELVRRHTSLRTRIVMAGDGPLQMVAGGTRPLLAVQELAGRRQELAHHLCESLQAPFDLEDGALLRAVLYQLAANEHVLQVVAHPVAADAASLEVLLHDLAALYSAFVQEQPSPLAALPFQYRDYAGWERASSHAAGTEAALAAWRRRLDGVPPANLPTDFAPPPIQSTRLALAPVQPAAGLLASLETLGQSADATLAVVLTAAFAVLLHRYSGQEDFAISLSVPGCRPPAAAPLIGPFANLRPLRIDLSGAPTLLQLLRRIQETQAEADAQQDVRFEQLAAELHPEQDLNHLRIVQVIGGCAGDRIAGNAAGNAAGQFAGLVCERLAPTMRCGQLDLALDLTGIGCGGAWGLLYNTDLFEPATAARLAAQFEVLLAAIAAAPLAEIARLPMLPAAERQRVLEEWNTTAQELPRHLCIQQLFEAQAERTPDAPALLFKEEQLTYRELNERANRLAHYLQTLGVGPEQLVGLYMERSPEMIIGLLGILKAGGAYLPLDPAYPGERLAFMLADAQIGLLLTQTRLAAQLPPFGGQVICVDAEGETLARQPAHNPSTAVAPENLAYVIYTSGSTGQPKGTQIEHRSLVNYIAAAGASFGLGPGDRMLQFASISFDAAAEEIYCPLTRGAALVLRTDAMLDSVSTFLQLCAAWQLTVLDLPTAYWHALTLQLSQGATAIPEHLRLVIIGGERALAEPVQTWRKRTPRHVRLVNTYGPTEATVVATMCELGAAAPAAALPVVPIGRPVANVQIYLLDADLQPVPVGVPGEIYIGGAGVARGYLNRPELTAHKFIPHPFRPGSGERLYKTGDLARYLPDGNLDYIGRRDDQVKVRGFRVELGEIEAAINEHPGVGQGVVVGWDDGAGSKQLAAYLVASPQQELSVADLREHLAGRLPSYMIPAAFVVLDSLPLTTNGKVDRKRLPRPGATHITRSTAYVPPQTALELQLTQIWEQVLGLPQVGVNDDFFELGGHSLAAARLFVQIETWLGRSLPLATLFQAPTIAKLAAILQDDQWTPPWSSLVPIQPLGSKPPFFCVHGFGGDVVGYRDLALLLGPDQPFYGFQARGLNDTDVPHTDIAEMAADYIVFMRRLQPHGPYYLGGYCYGGVVAYEMARQLAAQGERVNLLAVLEGYAVERREVQRSLWRPRVLASFVRNLPYWLRDNLQPDGPYAYVLPWGKERRSGQPPPAWQMWHGPDPSSVPANDFASRRVRLEVAHDLAIDRYQPGPYQGRVALFRVKAMSLFRAHDQSMGWSRYAQGVDVCMISGAHYNILEQPYVTDLAAQLRRLLAEAQAKE